MKRFYKFTIYVPTLFLIILLSSCRKSLDAGIITTVSGIAYDQNKQMAIPNSLIYIQEYGRGFYGYTYKGIIDSTRSGLDGKYNIRFKTTGNGLQYRIGFDPNENFYTLQDATVLKVGKDTVVNFHASQLHVLKARLQIKENPNPPLTIDILWRFHAKVWGVNNDTTVYLKIIPNNMNEIQFLIKNIDSPSYNNYLIEPIYFQGFQDTFDITIPVFPKLFPKRG